MIITCKCGEPLTNKIGYKASPRFDKEDSNMLAGSFSYIKCSRGIVWDQDKYIKQKKLIVVAKEDILQEQVPKFETGMGCCDLDWEWVCSCGEYLGHFNFDCWQEKCATLIPDKIVLCYKNK